MSNSDVDVMTVSPSPHVNHKRSITDRKTEEKQEAKPSVKHPVIFTKNNKARPSVKWPVTPKMPNLQDSFRSTQMMKSPISQIKGGVKNKKVIFSTFH